MELGPDDVASCKALLTPNQATGEDCSGDDECTTGNCGNDDKCAAANNDPAPPAGKPEKNWIKTLPNKGWFTYFRLYGPTQPYFDKSWVLPDIEAMK